MSLSILDYSFWVASFVVEILLASILVRRKGRQYCPPFFWLIVYKIAKTCFLLYAYHFAGYWLYYYGYWTGKAIGYVFELSVLAYIFGKTIGHDSRTRSMLYFSIVSAAVIIAMAMHQPKMSHPTVALIVGIDRALALGKFAAFWAVSSLKRLFAISLRDPLFCISAGLGITASFDLVIAFMHAHFDHAFGLHHLNHLAVSAYLLSLVFWCLSLSAKRKAASLGFLWRLSEISSELERDHCDHIGAEEVA